METLLTFRDLSSSAVDKEGDREGQLDRIFRGSQRTTGSHFLEVQEKKDGQEGVEIEPWRATWFTIIAPVTLSTWSHGKRDQRRIRPQVR